MTAEKANELTRLWIDVSKELFPTVEEGLYRSHALANFLGYRYPEAGHFTELIHDKRVVEKLRALSGPHGKVVMKIMKIRNGEQ